MLLDLLFIAAGIAVSSGAKIKQDTERELEHRYVASKGYNKQRQDELSRMSTSASMNERAAFMRLAGRKVNVGDWWDREDAIREIASKEGWTYYDISELSRDPVYRKIIHAPDRPGYPKAHW